MTGSVAALAQGASDRALRAATAFWLPRFQSELDSVPRPANRTRQQAAGPDPVRVLVLGNGIANAFGVRTQDLALPGALARALRERTDRGVEVDLDARRGLRVESLAERLDEIRVWRYDAVVVTVGPTDAGMVLPVDRWRLAMRDLMNRLHSSLGPRGAVLALSITPMMRSPQGSDWTLRRVERYAERLDAQTRDVARTFPDGDVVFVPIGPLLEAAGEAVWASAAAYAALAEHLADLLAPRLVAHGTRAVEAVDDDDTRVGALEASGMLDARPSDRLIRLVRSARAMFGVRGVTLALVARDHLQLVTHSGVETSERPGRTGTLIDRVLRTSGLYELDLPPAFAANLPRLATGPVRFYAGVAIETPSGHPIGALCLFDDEPRGAGSIDPAAIHDLVTGIQTELWEAAAVRG